MGGLPGTREQIVTLSSQLSIGREEFNEMGIFVVDGPNGAVNGVLPGSPDTRLRFLRWRTGRYSFQAISLPELPAR